MQDTTSYLKPRGKTDATPEPIAIYINHADTIKNKEKVKREDLSRYKTDSNSGVTHEVDFTNQAPVFEGSPGNNADPVPSGGSSPIIEIPSAAHTGSYKSRTSTASAGSSRPKNNQ